jgi:hypothetical protein
MVCGCHLFILDEENALIGFRPYAIQTLSLIVPPQNEFEVRLPGFWRAEIAGKRRENNWQQ